VNTRYVARCLKNLIFTIKPQLGPNYITIQKPAKEVKPQPKPRPIPRKRGASKKKQK